MKQLILIRHAKSSWSDLAARDFDRDLSGRGKRDAPVMGARLAASGMAPELLMISAAQRTRSTAALMAEPLGLDDAKIQPHQELYLASPDTMLKTIRTAPEEITRLALLAHNPGITELANMFGAAIDNIPTSGIVSFEIPVDSWREVRGRRARLLDFDYPKRDS